MKTPTTTPTSIMNKLFLLIFLSSLNLMSYGQKQVGVNITGNNEHQNLGSNVAISADGKSIILSSTNIENCIMVYNENNESWKLKGEPICDESQLSKFGTRIAISADGNIIAISNPFFSDETGQKRGAVYIYEFIDEEWIQKGKTIIGSLSFKSIGQSINLSKNGNTICIGYWHDGKNQNGGVDIYNFEDNNWVKTKKSLSGSKDYERLGHRSKFAKDGQLLICSGKNISMDSVTMESKFYGIVKTFKLENDNWILANDPLEGHVKNSFFGNQIDVSENGETLVIQEHNDETKLHSLHVYENNAGQWKLVSSFPNPMGQLLNPLFGINDSGDLLAYYSSFDEINIDQIVDSSIVPLKKLENAKNNMSATGFDLSSNGRRVVLGYPNITEGINMNGVVKIYELVNEDE